MSEKNEFEKKNTKQEEISLLLHEKNCELFF